MQRTYTLEELAKFLNRPTKSLQKLAEKEVLKGRKIQGSWTFSLPDVVAWMETEITQIKAEESIALENAVAEQSADEDVVEDISIDAILDPAAIDLVFAAKTKSSVINDFVKLAENTGVLWDAETMAQALREREDMASTALENGVAILHPRRPQPNIIAQDFLALAISRQGVPFGGGFNNLTDVFFLLCCQTDASYLRTLGKLARILKTPGFLDVLRECANVEEVKAHIIKTERSLNEQ